MFRKALISTNEETNKTMSVTNGIVNCSVSGSNYAEFVRDLN